MTVEDEEMFMRVAMQMYNGMLYFPAATAVLF
jgi:hypothetical protein